MDQPRGTTDEDDDQDTALEDSFPASDPPAASNPGGGITGPESSPKEKRKS